MSRVSFVLGVGAPEERRAVRWEFPDGGETGELVRRVGGGGHRCQLGHKVSLTAVNTSDDSDKNHLSMTELTTVTSKRWTPMAS